MLIVGSLLFYAQEIDPTMLVALSEIVPKQSNGTEATPKSAQKLFQYCTTQQKLKSLLVHKSNGTLHSDTSYLSASKVTIIFECCFYLGYEQNSSSPNMHTISILSKPVILKMKSTQQQKQDLVVYSPMYVSDK